MIHNGAAEMATMSETFQTNCGVKTNARSTARRRPKSQQHASRDDLDLA